MKQVLMLFLAVCVAKVAVSEEQNSRREQAIDTLLKFGVKVERDDTRPGKPVTRVFFGCHRSPGFLVRELKYLPEVQVMNLRLKDDVTNEDLTSLRALVNMNSLLIHHCPISAESLAHLKSLPGLRTLKFSSTSVSDAGVRHLAALTKLEHLQITGKDITDRGVAYLGTLTNLKELRLTRTSVSEKGLTDLRTALPNTKISNY